MPRAASLAASSAATSSRNHRAASPYSGRPASPSPSVAPAARDDQDGSSSSSQPQPRYGLRSMLSSLIWGAPKQQGQRAKKGDSRSKLIEGNTGSVQDSSVHIVSDDEDGDEAHGPGAREQQQRFSSNEKGKGKADGAAMSAPEDQPAIGNRFSSLKSSQTFGDLRSMQRDVMPGMTSTPARREEQDSEEHPSPAQVNSTLASFFAEKGSQSLTADERRRISQLLMGEPGTTTNVPTALTPSFSFTVPPPSSAHKQSILSPSFKSSAASSSSSVSGRQSSLYRGGLAGSQSLSSLSSLLAPSAADGSTSRVPAAANPRSAISRRAAARPLYLGAGYSSSAVARRKRAAAQAQMNSLYGNLDTFSSSNSNTPVDISGTPTKRRRVEESADTPKSTGFGASSSQDGTPRFATSASLSSLQTPQNASPSPVPAADQRSSLFTGAPHLRARLGGNTPARPSPLRQAAVSAASPASPETPQQATQQSSPRTTTRTADLMKAILQESNSSRPAQAQSRAPEPAPADVFVETPTSRAKSPPPSAAAPARKSTRVPRESLIKQPAKVSTLEMLERTMPPELRSSTPNGKTPRPKPPPVPSSARKTRAAVAAEAARQKEILSESQEPTDTPASKEMHGRGETAELHTSVPSTTSRSSTRDIETSKNAAGDLQKAAPSSTRKAFDFSSSSSSSQSRDNGRVDSPAPRAFAFGSKAQSPVPAPAAQVRFQDSPQQPPPAQVVTKTISSPSFNDASSKTSKDAETAPSSTPLPFTSTNKPAPQSSSSSSEVPPDSSSSKTASGPEPPRADAKKTALAISTVALPAFTLLENTLSFATPNTEDDASIAALKQTVRDMPTRDLRVFELY